MDLLEYENVGLDSFFDSFQPQLTVCDKTYTCTGDDQSGYVWRSDVEGTAGVRGCRVDSLVAAASANGCHASIPREAPGACKVSEPCLSTDEDGSLTCFSQRSTNLPQALDAHWKCSDITPTRDTHEKTHTEDIGGLMTVKLQRKRAEAPPFEDYEAVPEATESLPNSRVEPPSDSHASSWKVCDWFNGSAQPSCKVDSDCPLSDPFDMWFDGVADGVMRGERQVSTHEFLVRASDAASKVELLWDRALLPDATAPHSKRELRSRLLTLHEQDVGFRRSVDLMLRKERDLRSILQAETSGACDFGRCSRNDPVRPSVALFDGSQPVTFEPTEDGLSYRTARGGLLRTLPSIACDTTSVVPFACRDPSVLDVSTTLDVGTAVRPEYRVNVKNDKGLTSRYLVQNRVLVKGDKSECAERLCDLNATTCPAPYCLQDGRNGCVPDPVMVASVTFE